MTDIAIIQNTNGQFDIELDGYDLKTEQGLRNNVMVSLFTDHRAEPDDIIPDGTNDRRGYWGDSYPDVEGDKLGSRLWLLSREKETINVLQRAQEYAEEGLQWLLDDGVASAVNVTTERVRAGVLGIYVTIILSDGSEFTDVFETEL